MTDAAKAHRGRACAVRAFSSRQTTPPDQPVEDLGKLSVLPRAGARRVRELPWHTLKAALEQQRASTE
jgi:hypothetical protein